MAGHAASDRVNAETDVDAFLAQSTRDLVDRMLRLGDGHTVTRDDHDFLGTREQLSRLLRLDRNDLALVFSATGRCAAAGAEATGNDGKEFAVHRAAHDVTQDRAARTDKCAGHDQQVIAKHEAGRRSGPAGVAVEHRNDHGHVGTADCHDHVDSKQQGEHGHDDERHHTATFRRLLHERVAIVNRAEQDQKVQPVSCRQDERVAADLPGQLAKGDHRT